MPSTDIGEEYLVDGQPDGDTITFLLFNDSTDTITEKDDLSAITSEPDGTDYARKSDTVTTAQLSGSGNGDYGYDNDSLVTFDVTDATTTIDSFGIVANFDSSVAGDAGTPADHLVAWGPLDTSFDLSAADTPDKFEFEAGDLEHKVSGS